VFDYYCAHAANRPTRRFPRIQDFRIPRISDPSCRCCHALITDLNGHCKPNSGCEKYLKHLIISVPVFRIFSTFFNPEIESHDRNAVQSDRFTQGFTLRVSSAHWPVSSKRFAPRRREKLTVMRSGLPLREPARLPACVASGVLSLCCGNFTFVIGLFEYFAQLYVQRYGRTLAVYLISS
jgi:hypothetical protein